MYFKVFQYITKYFKVLHLVNWNLWSLWNLWNLQSISIQVFENYFKVFYEEVIESLQLEQPLEYNFIKMNKSNKILRWAM